MARVLAQVAAEAPDGGEYLGLQVGDGALRIAEELAGLPDFARGLAQGGVGQGRVLFHAAGEGPVEVGEVL